MRPWHVVWEKQRNPGLGLGQAQKCEKKSNQFDNLPLRRANAMLHGVKDNYQHAPIEQQCVKICHCEPLPARQHFLTLTITIPFNYMAFKTSFSIDIFQCGPHMIYCLFILL
jgi:hypothetical protein